MLYVGFLGVEGLEGVRKLLWRELACPLHSLNIMKETLREACALPDGAVIHMVMSPISKCE